METKVIRHEGRVISVNGQKITVAFLVQSGCSSCKAQSKCGMVESNKREVEVYNSSGEIYEVGEKVTLGVTVGMGNLAVVLAYVVPLILLIALMCVGVLLNFAEWGVALLGLCGVAIYYVGLYILRDKIEPRINFTINK